MSRSYSAIKNKHQKHSKVHYQAYLYNANEPLDYTSDGTSPELEAELLENSASMRQEFRHIARRMRDRYA